MSTNGQNTLHFSKQMKGNFYINGLSKEVSRDLKNVKK